MEYVIETFSLTKVFSDWWGRERVRAVDNLNLRVRYNEVFGLLGPNGSGKTTTLKMLLGLLYPTKGKALVLGGDSTDPKISARIGFLPEESYLYRYLTARETLDFYGRLFGLNRRVRQERIEALLDMVGLKGVANRPVGTFSKGMARRIGLAQALINDPDLLILDEPTTGLDPIGTKQIKDLILELAKRGKTILLCSHLLADVEDVCDRIAVLYGGRIQAQGAVKDLLVQTGKIQITTTAVSDSILQKIQQILESEQAEFEVATPMDKLENFFIRTVTSAERQAQPTSGALTTGQISDFLRTQEPAEGILDKLVSAEVGPPETQPVSAQSETVGSDEGTEEGPDEKLLAELTASAEQEPIDQPEQPQTRPLPDTTENGLKTPDSILEQLTEPDEKKTGNEQQNQETNGDSSNA